jgi:hypothetical protein
MDRLDRRKLITAALVTIYAPTVGGMLFTLATVTGATSLPTLLGAVFAVPAAVIGIELSLHQLTAADDTTQDGAQ